MHQALYRVYRPKTFDEIVGQTQVMEVLKNQIIQGTLAHTYLFSGTRNATALVLNLIVLLTNCKVLSALKLRVLATLEEIRVAWGENPNFSTFSRARRTGRTWHRK